VTAWLTTFLACGQLGAVAVSVNTRLFRSHELADILQRSAARVLLFWPEFKGIDFAGILAACDPRALERLEAVVAYDEGRRTGAGKRCSASVAFGYELLAGSAPLLEHSATAAAGCGHLHDFRNDEGARNSCCTTNALSSGHAFDVVAGYSPWSPPRPTLLVPPLCGRISVSATAMAALACRPAPLVMAPAWDAEQAGGATIVAHRITHINGTDDVAAQLLEVAGPVLFERAIFSATPAFIKPGRKADYRPTRGCARPEARRPVRRQRTPGPVSRARTRTRRLPSACWPADGPVSRAARVARPAIRRAARCLPHGAGGRTGVPCARQPDGGAYHGNPRRDR